MRIFVDTSAFFALLDRDDANHKKAKDVWNKVINPENVLITTNYILVESLALIQHRLGMDAVMGLQEDILPIINIEWITPEIHRSGVSALLAASRRKLSLVDCISFEIMRNSAIKTIFTFDSHFEEQGFYCIP